MSSRALILGFALIVLTFGAIQTLDLRWQRQRAFADAERRASSQALALSEYVRGAFVATDSSLRQLAIHSRRIGGPSAPAAEWLPILEAAQASLNERGSLSVTDADGIIRQTTLPSILGQSRRDNYLFRQLSTGRVTTLVLDAPFISPVVKDRWIVPVGRRLETPDGKFDGMVVQVVTPEAFRSFFESIRIGETGFIKLFHPDGKVIVQQPAWTHPPAPDAAPEPLFQAIGGRETGLIIAPLREGEPAYVSAFRRIAGPELIVTVSLNELEFLADWQARRRRALIEFLALAGLMGVLVALLLRQIQARSRVERALAEVQRTEAARLRDANERLAQALSSETTARQESESASRLKDEFLMTLSHELRTPMNAILGWLHMLRTNTVEPDHRVQALQTIERNARAQARLIEDLLDVSRAVSSKLQIEPRPTDAGEVVRAAVATLQPAIAARSIDFHLQIASGLPVIQADPDRLQQVAWNLLSNAIKFSSPGGRVEVHVDRAVDGIRLAVSDQGAGIAAPFLPFVFERFRQADAGPRREHGGLGLGLAIAKHVVELHGGTITAESPGEGCGSTFRVHLPAHRPPDAAG